MTKAVTHHHQPPLQTWIQILRFYLRIVSCIIQFDNVITSSQLQDDISGREELFLEKGPLYHAKCQNAYTNNKTVAQKTKASVNITETSLSDQHSCDTVSLRKTTSQVDNKTEA